MDGLIVRHQLTRQRNVRETDSKSVINHKRQFSKLSYASLSLQNKRRRQLAILQFLIWSSHIWNHYPSCHLYLTHVIVSEIHPKCTPNTTKCFCAKIYRVRSEVSDNETSSVLISFSITCTFLMSECNSEELMQDENVTKLIGSTTIL